MLLFQLKKVMISFQIKDVYILCSNTLHFEFHMKNKLTHSSYVGSGHRLRRQPIQN